MNFFELFVRDVSIDLGGLNRGMAEHRLNAPNVGTVLEQVGRVRVAECMWRDLLRDPSSFGIMIDQSLDRTWRQRRNF